MKSSDSVCHHGFRSKVSTFYGALSRAMAWVVLVLLVFSMVLPAPASVVPNRVMAAPGDLVPSFGANGVVMTDFAGGNDSVQAVTASRLGKIIAAGSATISNKGTDFALACYDKNGNLDPSFGQGGKVTTDFFGANDGARGVVVQDDGKLVASGFATNGAKRVFGLARYLENGSLDPTFGQGGKLTLDLGSTSEAFKLALQADGKIVVVGDSRPQNSLDFTLVRLNPTNGSLDNSFGSNGVVRVDFGFTDRAIDLAIDEANIFVCGFVVKSQTDSDFGIARLNLSNGSLNNAFAGNGRIPVDFFGKLDGAQSILLRRPIPAVNAANGMNQTDAVNAANGADQTNDHVNILVGGLATTQTSDTTDSAIVAIDGQGSLINSLFNQGKATVDFNGRTDQIFSVIELDGGIVGIGWAGIGTNFDLGIIKWDPTGKLDSSWGAQGKKTLDTAAGGNNVAFDGMIFQNDLLTGGTGINPITGNDDFVITLHQNNTLDGEELYPISISGLVTDFVQAECGRPGSINIASATIPLNVNLRFGGTPGVVLNTGLLGQTVPAQPFEVIGTNRRINAYINQAGRMQLWLSTASTSARTFDITGPVQIVSPTAVRVNGLTFQFAPGTPIPPELVVGATVRMTGELDTNNRIALILVDPNPYRTATFCGGVQSLIPDEHITFFQNANFRCDTTVGSLSFEGLNIPVAPGLIIPGVVAPSNQCFNLVFDQFGSATTGTTVIPGTALAQSLSGTITYSDSAAFTSKPAPGVTRTTAGTPSATTTTNDLGIYTLSNLGSGPYTVTPSKTGDINGISSFDASLAAQFAAGLITLTPHQRIAADASGNGTISSFDASLIAQTAAGIANSGSAGTWKFVPGNLNLQTLSGNLTGQNFAAILVGDVSGNWTPPVNSPPLAADANPVHNSAAATSEIAFRREMPSRAQMMTVSLPQATGNQQTIVTIPIMVESLTGKGVASYDFTISFDPAVLQPSSQPFEQTGSLSRGMNLTFNASTPGRLTISAFSATPLRGEGLLLNLKFNVVGAIGSSTPLKWESPRFFIFNEDQPHRVDGHFIVSSGARKTEKPKIENRR